MVTTRHTASLRVVTVSIVLASASPARKRLLRAAGIEPCIVVSEVDEVSVTARARETYG